MAIIERRIFYGKVGSGGDLAEASRQFFQTLESAGVDFNTRILTDYQSGRTDRVVYEMEAESIGAIESAMAGVMEDPAAQEAFGKLEGRLQELITHAEVEHWQVQ